MRQAYVARISRHRSMLPALEPRLGPPHDATQRQSRPTQRWTRSPIRRKAPDVPFTRENIEQATAGTRFIITV